MTNIVKEDVICRTHAVPICSWLKLKDVNEMGHT